MTRKKEIKKRKLAKMKKNKKKKSPTLQRFVKKVTSPDDLPLSKVVVEPNGHEKMSEVILDFAEPLLDECENEATERIGIAMAILVWNLSLFPEKDQDQELLKVCSEISGSDDAKQTAELLHHANLLLERKKKYYANNQRCIIKYELSGSGRSRRLDIASTLSS